VRGGGGGEEEGSSFKIAEEQGEAYDESSDDVSQPEGLYYLDLVLFRQSDVLNPDDALELFSGWTAVDDGDGEGGLERG
jgi:hypothetical protein